MPTPDTTSTSIRLGSIDETSIRNLVHDFYGTVMADPLLAPIFGREVASDDWPGHLERMCAFWSSVLLRSGRYDGRPMAPHLRMPDLADAHFARWLSLFAEAVDRNFAEDDRAGIIGMAERIGHSFRLARATRAGSTGIGLDMIRARPQG